MSSVDFSQIFPIISRAICSMNGRKPASRFPTNWSATTFRRKRCSSLLPYSRMFGPNTCFFPNSYSPFGSYAARSKSSLFWKTATMSS